MNSLVPHGPPHPPSLTGSLFPQSLLHPSPYSSLPLSPPTSLSLQFPPLILSSIPLLTVPSPYSLQHPSPHSSLPLFPPASLSSQFPPLIPSRIPLFTVPSPYSLPHPSPHSSLPSFLTPPFPIVFTKCKEYMAVCRELKCPIQVDTYTDTHTDRYG